MPEPGEIKRANEIGYKSRDKYIWHTCEICGICRWVRFREGKPTNKRCSHCNGGAPGDKNGSWKGGRSQNSYGYILVLLQPNDFFYPMTLSSRKQGRYVLEHRLIVAKALGRCLQSWEIVHHKHDKYPAGSIENKQDNRYPENLQLVTDDRHKQITILESKIANQDKRIKLLEWQVKELNIQLREVKEYGKVSL